MKWHRLLLFVLSPLWLAPAVRADVTNGLVAYLKVDETTGLTAFDSTTNGHNAILTNFPSGNAQWISGRINGALNVNANTNNQRADIDDSSGALNFGAKTTPAFSLAAWVRADAGVTQSPGAGIICKGYGRGGEEFAMDVYAGAFRFLVRNFTGTSITLAPGVAAGDTWQHLVGTCDCANTNGGLKFYINGQLIAYSNSPSSLLSNLHEISLGSRESNNVSGYTLPFYGALDDVHIYNRALTASDVLELYNNAEVIPPVPDSEFAVVRQLWLNTLNGGTNLNTNDPTTILSLGALSASAQLLWSTMNSSPSTCLWSDLPGLNTNSENMWYTYARLETMSLAYATPGTTLYTNSGFRTALTNALDWMNANVYNPTKSMGGNWWHFQIGVPLWLNDITLLLYNTLTGAQITNYMNAVNYFTPTPTSTGANLVWEATVVGVRGAIVDDSSQLAAAIASLSTVFPYVTNDDGFYMDGSFIQHSYFAYTGSYGSSLLLNLAPLLYAVNGSRWAVTDTNLPNVYQWVYNAYQPVIYSAAMMSMVRGRAMSRQGETDQIIGQQTVAAIIRLAQCAPPADAAAFDSMAKNWMQADTASGFITNTDLGTLPLAEAILSNPGIVPRGELLGHYHFGSMDRALHLRPGYGFGISMSSSRIKNYESINGENLHGWHTGDGMTCLYNADQTQFDDNFWPTVNPYRLPGTTVDMQTRANSSGAGTLGPYSWVGGADLNGFGSAGMQLKAWNSDLTAEKSWFMFNDEVVCLGAGITSTSNRDIETIVENRKLTSAATNVFTVNGANMPATLGWSATMTNVSSAWLAGNVLGTDIGYYFPQSAALNGLRQTNSGSWYDINTYEYNDTSIYTRNYLTLWFDHGTNPVNSSYSYVLLPDKSAAFTVGYAGSPPISILQNSALIQGVSQIPLGITAANFWNDGVRSVGAITVNRKAAVLLQLTETNLALAVADPTQTNTAGVLVIISNAVAQILSLDPGVTVSQMAPTLELTVNTSGGAGKSYHANFLYNVTNFAAFQTVHFSAAQLADPAISGPSADPGNDGIGNLMKYALMLDPWQSYAAAYQASVVNGHFTMTYTRRKLAADLAYTVEVSNDLRSWNSSGTQFIQTVVADNGMAQTIQVTDNAVVSSHTARYFCLFVSLTGPA